MDEPTRPAAENLQPDDPTAVWLYPDGVYRWSYEKDLLKNRYEMNYILKIVALAFGLSWVLILATMLLALDGEAGWALGLVTAICLGGGLLTAGIVLLVQRISARSRGGKDVISYEMDERGLRQIRSEASRGVDSALSAMTGVSGMVIGNAAVAGNSRGIVEGTHPDITDYGQVRKIDTCPKYDVIDVTLKGNYKCRVYVREADMPFVRDFIARRAAAARAK